jgi:hypothetical protein
VEAKVTSMLDPDARDLLRLAKLAEQALPRDPERVRQRVLVAVGAAAATSTVASHSAAASAAAKTTGIVSSHAALAAGWLPALVKTVAVVSAVSGLALAGGTAYRMGAAEKHANAPAPQRTSLVQHTRVTPVGATVATTMPVAAPSIIAPSIVAPSIAPSLVLAAPNSPRQDSAPAKVHAARDALRETSLAAPEAPASKREAQPAPDAEPAAATSVSSLSADLRTLSAAQQAFNSGAPARTLTLLRDLRGSELLAERSALEVFALCALGQTEAASQKAALFRSIASSSPLLPRVNASCAKP